MKMSEDLDNEFRNAYRKLHENFVCEMPDYSGDEPNFDNLFKSCSLYKAIKAKNYYLRFKTKLPVSMVERISVETEWRLSKDWLLNEESKVDSDYFNDEEWKKYNIEAMKFFLLLRSNAQTNFFYNELYSQVLKYQYTYIYLEGDSFVIGIQNKKRYDNLLSFCNATRNWFEYRLGILKAQNIHYNYINAIKSGSIDPRQLINELAEIKANLEFDMFKQASIDGTILYGHQVQLSGLEPISKYLDTIKDNPLFINVLPKSLQNKKNTPKKYHSLTTKQIDSLYKALIDEYIDSETTLEQFEALFDSNVTEMATPIQWLKEPEELVILLGEIYISNRWQTYLQNKQAFKSREGTIITASTYSTYKSNLSQKEGRTYKEIRTLIERVKQDKH